MWARFQSDILRQAYMVYKDNLNASIFFSLVLYYEFKSNKWEASRGSMYECVIITIFSWEANCRKDNRWSRLEARKPYLKHTSRLHQEKHYVSLNLKSSSDFGEQWAFSVCVWS